MKITEWALRLNSTVESALEKINGKADGASRKFTQLQNSISSLEAKSSNLGRSLTGAFAPLLAGAGLGMIGHQIFEATAAAESFNVAMTTMLKSKEKADVLTSQLAKFAETTPFELAEVQQATRKLIAFGVGASDVQETLLSIGNVSAGVGAPLQEIAELYGKAKVQGRLFAEDINQFQGRGIPIIQELSKQFGVTDSQVKKLVETGNVGFDSIKIAFESMSGPTGQFYNLMEAQSNTLAGKTSNLNDKLNQLYLTIGNDLKPAIVDMLGTLSQGLSWITNNWSLVSDVLSSLGIAIGTTGLALLLYKTYAIGATIAQLGLNAAIAANPVGAIIIGVMALITVISLLWKRFSGFRETVTGMWEGFKNIFMKIGHLASEIFGGIGDLIKGILNPFEDFDKVQTGLNRITGANAVNRIVAKKAADDFGANWLNPSTSFFAPGNPLESSNNTRTPLIRDELNRASNSIAQDTKQSRNVTVTINKLIEKVENHFRSSKDISNGELEKKITEVVIRAVQGAEYSLGNG